MSGRFEEGSRRTSRVLETYCVPQSRSTHVHHAMRNGVVWGVFALFPVWMAGLAFVCEGSMRCVLIGMPAGLLLCIAAGVLLGLGHVLDG